MEAMKPSPEEMLQATMRPPYEPQWGRTTRMIVLIALIIGGVYALTLLAPVFQMLSIAFMVAFLLYNPAKVVRQRLHLPWAAAVAFVYMLVIIFLFFLILTFLPAVVRNFNTLILSAQEGYDRLLEELEAYEPRDGVMDILGRSVDFNPLIEPLRDFVLGDPSLTQANALIDTSNASPAPETTPVPETGEPASSVPEGQTNADAVETATGDTSTATGEADSNPLLLEGLNLQQLLTSLGSVAGSVTGTVTSAITSLTGFIATLLLALFVSLLILLDIPKNREALESWVPEVYRREVRLLIQRIVRVWNGFFRGQVSIGIIIGAITYIQLVLMGIPSAEILAIITGLISLIPTIGGFIALIPLALVPLVQGSSVFTELGNGSVALLVVGVNVLISQVIWNVLAPKILGDALDLPLPVVVVGIFIGAAIGGVLGAFLVAPVMASIRVIVEYTLHKLAGRDPFPGEDINIKPRPA